MPVMRMIPRNSKQLIHRIHHNTQIIQDMSLSILSLGHGTPTVTGVLRSIRIHCMPPAEKKRQSDWCVRTSVMFCDCTGAGSSRRWAKRGQATLQSNSSQDAEARRVQKERFNSKSGHYVHMFTPTRPK